MQEIYRFIDDAIEADRQRYTDIAYVAGNGEACRFQRRSQMLR